MVHTVVETVAYLAVARACGMTDEERERAVLTIAADPTAGEIMIGTRGCRKLRIAGRGKGKSGGYRVVTYYAGTRVPVFLLAVLYKGSSSNFSDAETNAIARVAQSIVKSLGPRAAG